MSNLQDAGWNLENSYAQLPEFFYSDVKPTAVQSPQLVMFNESLATSIGLNADVLKSEGAAIFAGNALPTGSEPIAQAYAGHQFGHFTMLGDGRAVLLGEQITSQGDRFDIQLKGAGRTPYSRGGDGRAALGPMLREYVISEAMHALGIQTTRSLAVVTTGEVILREKKLPGAILTRVASSHIRVGTFQYVANFGEADELKKLADYTIQRHYPFIKDEENQYLLLFKEVIKRQAELIAKWQLVGFIHGVMNTDNMTISGETIDYGPCAFMNQYDPKTVFSSIDHQGRYAYGNQPLIGEWNLARFAESILPLFHEEIETAVKLAEEALSEFRNIYHEHWLRGMRAKLGLLNEEKEDETLIDDLLELMQRNKADYTNTFRAFTLHQQNQCELYGKEGFKEWVARWQARQSRQEEAKEEINQWMKKHNPAVIPRNHRVEDALEAAVNGDMQVMHRLLAVLANPYAYSKEQEEYSTVPEVNFPYQTFCGT